ncbi:hypothetical protein, partial [Cohnella faecalis]|uniref:hypothetical protein n=1 Tax=Cohnella faecalis TaxID=2315694 RepID=UPI001F273BF1
TRHVNKLKSAFRMPQPLEQQFHSPEPRPYLPRISPVIQRSLPPPFGNRLYLRLLIVHRCHASIIPAARRS